MVRGNEKISAKSMNEHTLFSSYNSERYVRTHPGYEKGSKGLNNDEIKSLGDERKTSGY
jgi:hypothetical protein